MARSAVGEGPPRARALSARGLHPHWAHSRCSALQNASAVGIHPMPGVGQSRSLQSLTLRGTWETHQFREPMGSIRSHIAGEGQLSPLAHPRPSGTGRREGLAFLAEESPSHQPVAKARLRPDPAAQQRAHGGRDSSLALIGPYRSADMTRSACGSSPFTSALPSWAPLLCLPEVGRLNWPSCHRQARAEEP